MRSPTTSRSGASHAPRSVRATARATHARLRVAFGTLKRSLTSQAMLGRVVTREPLTDAHGNVQRDAKGRKVFGPETVVVGDDGSPVVRTEPILSPDMFERVGVELEGRENRKEPTVRYPVYSCAASTAGCVGAGVSPQGRQGPQASVSLCVHAVQGPVQQPHRLAGVGRR